MFALKVLFFLANVWPFLPAINCQTTVGPQGPTRWGIISAGLISSDFAAVIRSMPQTDHQIVAIAARSLSSAQDFAKKYSITRAYGSYEELAKDANVQVVYIGAINTVHRNVTLLMLEHGKHVLVEKPMAMNRKEAEEMINAARSRNLFLMEALWTRFLPSYLFALDQIRSGVIGDVQYVYDTFGVYTSNSSITRDRLMEIDLGGGTLLDLGVYTINFAQMVYDDERPISVKAVGQLNNDGVDISVAAVFLYESGRTATIATHAFAAMANEGVVVGTNGTVVVVSHNLVLVNGKRHEFPFPSTEKLNFGGSSGMRYEFDEVRRCLLSGRVESERMSHNKSLIVEGISDEIRRQIGVVYDVD